MTTISAPQLAISVPCLKCHAPVTVKASLLRAASKSGIFCPDCLPSKRQATAVPAIREQMTYEEYLRSPHWQDFRKQALAHYGRQCCLCPAEGHGVKWNVHHRHYNSLGREQLEDVRVLCEDCHHLYEDCKKATTL